MMQKQPDSRTADVEDDSLEARVAALETALAQFQRQVIARLARIGSQTEALLRLSVDEALWPTEPQYVLNYRRFGVTSQNGEEGMLLALLSGLGRPLERFVEIGCGNNGGNSGFFAGELGWEGLMVDRRAEAVAVCRKRFGHNSRLRLVTAIVTPENVDDLVREAGLSGEVDYVSIDIDSVDYWVLEALSVVRPRVLVLEYNAYLGPERSVTVPRDADFTSVPKGYFGASLVALTKLAARKGYRLIACEETGVNAFFLRSDLRPDIPGAEPAAVFRRIKMPLGRSHEGAPRDAEAVAAKVFASGLPLVEV
jgi:hypothetical protein